MRLLKLFSIPFQQEEESQEEVQEEETEEDEGVEGDGVEGEGVEGEEEESEEEMESEGEVSHVTSLVMSYAIKCAQAVAHVTSCDPCRRCMMRRRRRRSWTLGVARSSLPL